MTYRDILVPVDDAPASALRVGLAAQLAGLFKAQLTGVFLTSELPEEIWVGESVALFHAATIEQHRADHRKAVKAMAEQARQQFEQVAAQAGGSSGWLEVRGDAPAEFYGCARRTDLVVFPKSAKVCHVDNRITAAQVALASGGPMLIVPDLPPPDLPRRVLVAWNGGREAARALRDAWPIIQAAEEVHVLVVSPHGEDGPDGMLQRHLERHGCAANIVVDRSSDASAGEILERRIEALGIDLMVMGLYGRPRLQELILGGVSRRMLQHLPVPVLVSH